MQMFFLAAFCWHLAPSTSQAKFHCQQVTITWLQYIKAADRKLHSLSSPWGPLLFTTLFHLLTMKEQRLCAPHNIKHFSQHT